MYENLVHRSRTTFSILEVHGAYKTTLYIGAVIDLCFSLDSHTAIPVIFGFAGRFFDIVFFNRSIALIPTHTGITGPVKVADFLFQLGYTDSEVCQFVSKFACQFFEHCSLFCVQLVFTCHHAGNNLCQFVTGDVSFSSECAVRVTDDNALVGQVCHCLVSPVVSGYIRERVSSVCGYACCECCNCSDCENLFHRFSPPTKK